MDDADAAALRAASTARLAGDLRAAAVRDVAVLAGRFAAVDLVVRDVVVLRAAAVRDFGAVFFAVPDFDAAVLRAVVPVRADAVDRDRLDAAVDLRAVPDLDAVLFFAAVVFFAAVPRVPVDLAVVVMTFAAASIALAASDIALVALVMALVIAVMAFADEDALVATDFICVAAVLAWLAALVTRVAAADDVRLDAAVVRFLAVELLDVPLLDVVLLDVPRFAAVVRLVVDLVDAFAAEVRLAAGLRAAADLVVVLFVRVAVLVGTDLPQ